MATIVAEPWERSLPCRQTSGSDFIGLEACSLGMTDALRPGRAHAEGIGGRTPERFCGLGQAPRTSLLLAVLWLLSAACRQEPVRPEARPADVRKQPAVEAIADAKPDPKMLPAHKLKKEEILVGGCKDACEDPKNAFRNFVRVLLGRSGPTGAGGKSLPELKRFIDTTMLVDNGRKLGEEWAGLWLAGKTEERQKSVEEWLGRYRARSKTAFTAEAIEDALATGLQFQRISSTQVRFEFAAPPRGVGSAADAWTVVMGKRGLEWLVQEIYDAGP